MSETSAAVTLRVALVTGAARRIGAEIARALHADGYALVIHHHTSGTQAQALAATLNAVRAGSALVVAADIRDPQACGALVETAHAWHGRLDLVVNNASSFYPTPVGEATAEQWLDLVGTNMQAPFFIVQAAAAALAAARGAVVNLVDIHAERPLADHPIYCAAKAGLVSLTRSLARDLAPHVRVNAIAPGAILWPVEDPPEAAKAALLRTVPLGHLGNPGEIARAVRYLCAADGYVTGQVLAVDGGRTLT